MHGLCKYAVVHALQAEGSPGKIDLGIYTPSLQDALTGVALIPHGLGRDSLPGKPHPWYLDRDGIDPKS